MNDGVLGLVERVFPAEYRDVFRFELANPGNTGGFFQIEGGDGNIVVIRGDSESSQLAALGHYIKYYCKVNLSWCGSAQGFPAVPPIPSGITERRIVQKIRSCYNFCTFSYSMAFWDWERWEREIDFMALSGINMPLSAVGTEVALYYALIKHRFTEREALETISSSAYYAWQLMGNIEGVMPVVEKSYIEHRMKLGKRIIERERELGMTPILQGFSGVVPLSLKNKYPAVAISKMGGWANHKPLGMIDPTDPFFYEFGMSYLNAERELFGDSKYYAADLFHEGAPPKKGNAYLKASGEGLLRLMSDFRGDSVIVMQAWSLRKKVVKGLPKARILIFDINGEQYKKNAYFWGYDFVLGVIQNFGGRSELAGDIRGLVLNKYARLQKRQNLVGTGLFPEAIETNPLYFDLAFEVGITDGKVEIESWLAAYAERRYGFRSEGAYKALSLLKNTVYRRGSDVPFTEDLTASIVCARPTVDEKSKPIPWSAGFDVPYDNNKLIEAFKALFAEHESLGNSDGFKYDVVDLLRQILSNIAKRYHAAVMTAYAKRDAREFRAAANIFLELLLDMDTLLLTRKEFDFNTVLCDARRVATSYEERLVFDRSARALYTVWGPVPVLGGDDDRLPELFDYACHEMAGLIADFYAVRWRMFFDMLEEHMLRGEEYNPQVSSMCSGRESFFGNDFYEKLGKWELGFVNGYHDAVPTADRPDLVETVNTLMEKYL